MMKLTINGIEAELKTDTTFKLVRENPYFSENSDYTFDVALPLRECPQNRLIFGLLDRPEVAHADLLIKKALMKKYNEDELSFLNDEFEKKAHEFVMKTYIG